MSSVLQIGMNWMNEYNGGGLDRYYYDLVRFLAADGVGIHGLVLGSSAVTLCPTAEVRSFATARAKLPFRIAAARGAVRDALARRRISLVASHFPLFTFPALNLLGDIPLVVHFHGPWAAESRVEGQHGLASAAKLWVEKRTYRRATRIIVLSHAFAELLCRTYDIDAGLVRVIPGGIDVERFDCPLLRDEARARLALPTDRPIVLSVRRLAKRMGLENLIDALSAIRTRIPDILVVIVGRGPLWEKLKSMIAERSLEQHVVMTGYVPDDQLPLYYRSADLTITPTMALEGFGLVTLESLALGTPVLVTPAGGLPEVVAHLSRDLILADTTAEAICDGVIAALIGPVRLPSAQACRDYANSNFGWRSIAKRVGAVYAEAS